MPSRPFTQARERSSGTRTCFVRSLARSSLHLFVFEVHWTSEFTQAIEESVMLSWALTFFIVAIIAAVLGFTSIAGAAAGIAKILFFIFLILTLVALVAGSLRGRPPV
jgi:uncharacterized membrane protein YtjA (UPF0391 family)